MNAFFSLFRSTPSVEVRKGRLSELCINLYLKADIPIKLILIKRVGVIYVIIILKVSTVLSQILLLCFLTYLSISTLKSPPNLYHNFRCLQLLVLEEPAFVLRFIRRVVSKTTLREVSALSTSFSNRSFSFSFSIFFNVHVLSYLIWPFCTLLLTLLL